MASEGVFKTVADQWRADPSLLCNTSDVCVDAVRKGNRVFPQVKRILFYAVISN